MEVLKSNHTLTEISAYDRSLFNLNAAYLWIWNPSEIPPHMGLSIENAYFSLKSNGLDNGIDLKEMIQRIERKRIPVIALELDLRFTATDCYSIFSNFSQTIPHKITCLNPIKEVLGKSSPSKLIELLEILDSKEQILRKTAWNLPFNSLDLPEYSVEEIHAHLKSLPK